jgi:uncharacterized membrane protein YadS
MEHFSEGVNTIISYLMTAGRAVCIIAAIIEVIKKIKAGDKQKAINTAIEYAVAYLVLRAIPWVFDIAESLFGG